MGKKHYFRLHRLTNYEKPHGYRYYQYYWTDALGDYIIYSRDGKRYYIDRTRNSKLSVVLIPDMPFKTATAAKKELIKLVKRQEWIRWGIR